METIDVFRFENLSYPHKTKSFVDQSTNLAVMWKELVKTETKNSL